METQAWPRPFTSALTRREAALVLVWLPLHVVVLRYVFTELVFRGTVSAAMANFFYYLAGFLYMLLAAFGFLRRDYDALADRPLRVIGEVLSGYGLMFAFNFLVGMALLLLLPEGMNPNNQALIEAAGEDSRPVEAAVVFLAPAAEELMFRAGIFGLLRKRSRRAAYAVSVLCFSIYHIAPYAVLDPVYLLYLVQYLPASFLLARCYERANTIWAPIFFHMLVNSIAMFALQALN